MTHQQSISEFLALLYQERILIAKLYEKKDDKRLYQKSEILKLCRENPERLDRLLKWEILKPRRSKFELNQSLYESFSLFLRKPASSSRFSYLIEELKEQIHFTNKGSEQQGLLIHVKNLIRNLEESLIQELEKQQIKLDLRGIEKLAQEMHELQSYLWEEKGFQIYRDTELDLLIQDIGQLLIEGLNSLKNIQMSLKKGKSQEHVFLAKMMKLTSLQRMGKLLECSNLSQMLENSHSLVWENVQIPRPRISFRQLNDKTSLNLLAKFQKKGKKR